MNPKASEICSPLAPHIHTHTHSAWFQATYAVGAHRVHRTRKVLEASFPQNPQAKRSNFFHYSPCQLDLCFLPLPYAMTPNKCPWASQPCQEHSTTAHQRQAVLYRQHSISLQPWRYSVVSPLLNVWGMREWQETRVSGEPPNLLWSPDP